MLTGQIIKSPFLWGIILENIMNEQLYSIQGKCVLMIKNDEEYAGILFLTDYSHGLEKRKQLYDKILFYPPLICFQEYLRYVILFFGNMRIILLKRLLIISMPFLCPVLIWDISKESGIFADWVNSYIME